jgi:pimeloyl-ACP methyl ester carboxylesterase
MRALCEKETRYVRAYREAVMSIEHSEETTRSADGTAIGFLKLGSGPALVCAHGSLTTGDEWIPLASALAERFTCVLMDRRGRGRSGDDSSYSLDKECEDIEAVLRATRAPYLLGHSYGAICTLEAAARYPIEKLVLYEPPLPIEGSVVGPAFQDFKAAADREALDEALTIGLRDLVRMSEDELKGLRKTPLWSMMASLTPTWTREIAEIEELKLGVDRYAEIMAPTLLLVGSVTAPHHVVASRALEQVLPISHWVELRGQGHQAHLGATTEFAAAVEAFLAR